MSKLEKLIEELCPDGVEYRTLGELGSFYGGLTGKKKDDFINGNSKFISYTNVFSNLIVNTEISDLVKINEGENQRALENGDIIFTGSSETPNECGMSSVFINDTNEPYYLNSFCFIFRLFDKNLLLPHFSKYLFRSHEIRKKVNKTASGVTRFNVSKKKMEKVKIPIPPLPIQEEIVRILDSYTELNTKLISELTSELEARHKQYECYRDELLTFGDGVELNELGDICKFTYGFTDKAKDYGNVRFIRITDINSDGVLTTDSKKYIDLSADNEKYLVKQGDLIMARTGATYGKTLYVDSNEPAVYASFLIKIDVDKTILSNRYYWHFSKSGLYWEQANKLVTTGGQPQFNANSLKKVKIPIPSLEEQQRIVDILDKYENIYKDISTQIQAEIEARQKQYEYYRDKLLTFKIKD